MSEAVKEGWYEDPADRHEYRWFSAGTPTDLVKDGDRTSRDAISMTDTGLYQQMPLEQPPDNSPLLHKNDASPPKFELLNLGQGPVAVVNTAASRSGQALYVKPPGVAELLVVFLPMLVALVLFNVPGLPLFVPLLLIVMTPVLAVLGRARRRHVARRFQRVAASQQGQKRG